MLEYHANFLSELVDTGTWRRYRFTGYPYFAFGRLLQKVNTAKKSTLATTTWAYDTDHSAFGDMLIYALEYFQFAVGLMQVGYLNHFVSASLQTYPTAR